ncbi:MAG: tellurite resistance TerB family protein [Defluviicoccus sp.]|nr:MAG: tellurite resistance TerB family protein [Defluviicoccus sp.]
MAALAGAVLGGRQGGTGAVGGGLLALLGSLAFSAWKNRDATGGSAAPQTAEELAREAPLGLREPQSPQEEAQLEQTALLAIRAMINAAKADGAIDGAEMGKIMGKLKEFGSDDEARDFVMSELQKPFDLDGLVAAVNNPELAVQVYGASLLAIEVDTPAEREYLQKLADKLGLDKETVCYIHETLGVAT